MHPGFDSNYPSDDGQPSRAPGSRMSVGIALGLLIGVALGAALDTIALGIALGSVVGVALGMALETREQPDTAPEMPANGRMTLMIGLGLLALAIFSLVMMALLMASG